MHPDIVTLLKTKSSIDVAILFEVASKLGSTTHYIRHSIDNYPLVTNSGSVTWTPWVINTQEFISRLNESTQPTDITLFDPEDTSLPGKFKLLLQYEKILNRATFNLWVVFKDPSPNITQNTIGTSVDVNAKRTVLSFDSIHDLNIFDTIEVDHSGTGNWIKHQVISKTESTITTKNTEAFLSAIVTVRKPFYKDSTTWHKKISGKLRGATYSEGFTVLKIGQESDLLEFDVPNVTYSYQCPYKPGDSNCTRKATNLVSSAVYNINNAVGNSVTLTTVISTVPAGKTVPPPAQLGGVLENPDETEFLIDQSYWALGSFAGLTGGLSGIVRSIRKAEYNSSADTWQLTLDQPILGSFTSGTVEVHFNCNRTFEDCRNRMANSINFGGLETIVRSVGGINVPRQINTE